MSEEGEVREDGTVVLPKRTFPPRHMQPPNKYPRLECNLPQAERAKVVPVAERGDLLEQWCDHLIQGGHPGELAHQNPLFWGQHCHTLLNALKGVQSLRTQHTIRKVRVTLLYGEPGVGKTTDAMFNEQTGELHPDQFTWKEQESFMDQYGGQHRVVIDDVRGITPIGMLLDLLEFKPVIANQKNSGTAFQGIDIYLTSNYHPDEWYPDPKDAVALAALKGRFHYVTHYTEGHRLRYERGSRAFCSLMRLQYIE